MSSFFERVRAALAPRGYEVVRELASGGMGTVFLTRQIALDRLVAIKVTRPEHHTAHAAERFLREAQALALLAHPNIVRVFDFGEAAGIPFYVMEYLEGKTVADHVAAGPLDRKLALKLGRDLLAALEAAHNHAVVHRDVKPNNLFFIGGSAILVDFGIAKRRTEQGDVDTPEGPRLTDPGAVPGTLDYMAPEQLAGGEATPASDLYSAAMVIYEAYTGRHWNDAARSGPVRAWAGVPRRVARVLRRGLELAPADRWSDATSFRRALWHTRVRTYQWRTFWLASGGLAAGAMLVILFGPVSRAGPTLEVQVEPFETSGAAPPWLPDSVTRALIASLGRYPDVVVRRAGLGARLRRATVLGGTVSSTPDSVYVTVRGPGRRPLLVARGGALGRMQVVVDNLADDLFAELLGLSPIDSSFFAAVRPTTPGGRAAFLQAEQLFVQARWGEAYVAYGRAAAADTGCKLCYWRQAEVGRWHGLPHDRSVIAPYLGHIGAFPPPYQSLIRADTLPVAARLDALTRVTERWPDFLFGQFRRAEELMHRGPLIGHARAEAIAPYQEVLRLRPRFGPAWEHLAWIHIADGDSADAARALAQYRASSESSDVFTAGVRALLELAFAFRLQSEREARELLNVLPGQVEAAGFKDLDAGARFLPYFGDSRGAIEFGRLLEARPSFQRSALTAQALGYLGLGRPDSARGVLRRLTDRYRDPGLGLFAAELDAVLAFLDGDSAAAGRWPSVRQSLEGYASLRLESAERRRRAAWMLNVGARRFEPRAQAARYRPLLSGEPAPRPLSRLLEAMDQAAVGRFRRALEVSDPLTRLEPSRGHVPDPFFLTLLHLVRAGWYERAGGAAGDARRELLWHEHSDLFRYPTRDAQPAEVDWAFGPLARWRYARLLEESGDFSREICRAYHTVMRHWAGGEPAYSARADSARRRLVELQCGEMR
ncbi:MAG: protein kinase domain-containing protein [Gemmatimonadales bacterium]